MVWRGDVMGPGNAVEVVLRIRQCDHPVVVNRAVRRAADGLMSRGDDVTDDQEGGACNTNKRKSKERKREREKREGIWKEEKRQRG